MKRLGFLLTFIFPSLLFSQCEFWFTDSPQNPFSTITNLEVYVGDTFTLYAWIEITDFPNIGSFSLSLKYNDTLSPHFEALDAQISEIWNLYLLHGVSYEGDTENPFIRGVVTWYAAYPVVSPFGPYTPYYVGYITLSCIDSGFSILDTVIPTFLTDTTYTNVCYPDYEPIEVDINVGIEEKCFIIARHDARIQILNRTSSLSFPFPFDEVFLYDITGRILLHFARVNSLGLSGLKSGVYFLVLRKGRERRIYRLILLD